MIRSLIILAILFFMVIFADAVKAQDKIDSDNNETKVEKQEYDQNIKITKKPRVSTARFCSQSSGVAILRATFDKLGKVTNVEVTSPSGCKSFDNNAVRAAKKIKFTPAIKDGEPVTITKLVQYSFTLYIK